MLFADSLLDVSVGRKRRGWSSVAAYAIEAALVAGAVLLPVWSTQALPHFVSGIKMMGPPIGRAPRAHSGGSPHTSSHAPVVDDGIHAPSGISPIIDLRPDKPRAGAGGGDDPLPPGVIPCERNCGNGIPTGLLPTGEAPIPKPEPPPKPQSRIIVSGGVQAGYLLRNVQPVYPQLARSARVEGSVVLAAVISREGVVENLHAVSGHPMLVGAAIDAVRQWRYRPYLLNGAPVEVETQITVNFILGK